MDIGFTHHGAVQGVTGSCHQLHTGAGTSLLVDCGLFQGEEGGSDTFARHRIDFSLQGVMALVVTHVHIDHIGRLPYLMAAGFEGPIYCSEPSAKLLPLVIEDALKIGFTNDRALIERFLARVDDHLVPLPYGEWRTVSEDTHQQVRIRLQRAGHILGSAYVEVDLHEMHTRESLRVVFSGDLGAPYSPLLPAPRSPSRADILVMESTYGDRLHEDRRHRRDRLRDALERALADGGTVLVPAFSIGRTQELLYEIESIIHDESARKHTVSGRDWNALEIIVDSPLAARFTEVYQQLAPYWDAEARRRLTRGRHPLDFDSLYTVTSHENHLRTVAYLAESKRPAVVLAASGMATGGRIVNYLKAMLGEPRHNVLFVGYQAPGTPGHAIQQFGPAGGWVELEGQRYTIRAGIDTLTGYSAHADKQNLVDFIRGMQNYPQQIRLVHGDRAAKLALKEALLALAEQGGKPLDVYIP